MGRAETSLRLVLGATCPESALHLLLHTTLYGRTRLNGKPLVAVLNIGLCMREVIRLSSTFRSEHQRDGR